MKSDTITFEDRFPKIRIDPEDDEGTKKHALKKRDELEYVVLKNMKG